MSSSIDLTEVVEKVKSMPEVDFNRSSVSNCSTNTTPRITESILVDAKIIPRHLAEIFYLPSPTAPKKKNPRITLTARVITGSEHIAKFQKKLDSDAKLEKEKAACKEERERKRKEKECAKIEKEKNKKQKKSLKVIQKPNENYDESPEPCTSTGVANNKSKRKTQVNARKSIQDVIWEMKKSTYSSSSDKTDSSSDESGDEQNVCFNCKSKYPPTKKHKKYRLGTM